MIVNDSRYCAGQRPGALRRFDFKWGAMEGSLGHWEPLEDYKLAK